MPIEYIDDNAETSATKKIQYVDDNDKSPIYDAVSKAEEIRAPRSAVSEAASATVNQVKNIINSGLFGQPERMFPGAFENLKRMPKGEKFVGDVLGGGAIGGAVVEGALKGIKAAYAIPAIKQNAAVEKATDLMYKLGSGAKVLTEKGIEVARQKIGRGLDAIYKHKEALQYGDEAGRLPKTIEEGISAANQTKQNIMAQYKALSSSMGETPLVDMSKVGDLIVEAYGTKGKEIAMAGTQKYALDLAKRYKDMGKVSIESAEEAITDFNKILEPFYKKGGFSTMADASQAGVDAVAASSIRKQVDSLIEGANGKSYQDLKNAYGSVAEIEKMLVKVLDKEMRKIKKPGVAVLDTVPIMYGAFTGNVPLVTAGILQKGAQATIKRLTDPTAIAGRAFNVLGKSSEKTLLQRAIEASKPVGAVSGVVSGGQ